MQNRRKPRTVPDTGGVQKLHRLKRALPQEWATGLKFVALPGGQGDYMLCIFRSLRWFALIWAVFLTLGGGTAFAEEEKK